MNTMFDSGMFALRRSARFALLSVTLVAAMSAGALLIARAGEPPIGAAAVSSAAVSSSAFGSRKLKEATSAGSAGTAAAFTATADSAKPTSTFAWTKLSGVFSPPAQRMKAAGAPLKHDISISKTVSTSTALPGDVVTYTITVTNDGPDVEPNVTVSDTIDPRANLTAADTATIEASGGIISGNNITWSLPSSGWAYHTTLASALQSGEGTIVAYSDQVPPISSDGKYMVYATYIQMTAEDTNLDIDVYRRNNDTGEVELVSKTATDQVANGQSFMPAMSADGRFIAFYTEATNLATDAPYGQFVEKDMVTGEIRKVSAAADGTWENAYAETEPLSVSGDGRYVTFSSVATNLVDVAPIGLRDIYRKDTVTGAITQASVASDGSPGDKYSIMSSISDDGQRVYFLSNSEFGMGVPSDARYGYAYVRDYETSQTLLVSRDSTGAPLPILGGSGGAISPDGTKVSFVTDWPFDASDTNGKTDIFVGNLRAPYNPSIASVAEDGTRSNGDSEYPALSSDGRFVTFCTKSTNLSDNTFNAPLLKDMSTGAVRNLGADDTAHPWWTPAGMSADGSTFVLKTQYGQSIDPKALPNPYFSWFVRRGPKTKTITYTAHMPEAGSLASGTTTVTNTARAICASDPDPSNNVATTSVGVYKAASGGGGGGGATISFVDPVVPSGWSNHDASVVLAATSDSGSPIITYRVNGGAPITYTGPILVSADGVTTIEYSAVAGGWQTSTRTVVVRIDKSAPTAPGIAVASAETTGAVTLTWAASTDAVPGIAYYNIYDNGHLIGSTTSNSIRLTGVTPGVHSYSIEAVDAAGNATRSADVLVIANGFIPQDWSSLFAPTQTVPALPAGDRLVYGLNPKEGASATAINLQLPYDANLSDERARALRVKAYVNGAWVEIPVLVDTANHVLRVTLSTLTPIAIVESTAVNASSVLTAPVKFAQSAYGAGTHVYVRCADSSGTPLLNRTIKLYLTDYSMGAAAITKVVTLTANASVPGQYRALVKPVRSSGPTYLRFVFDGDTITASSRASSILMPKAKISLNRPVTSIKAGGTVKLYGTLSPKHTARASVTAIAERVSGGRVITRVSKVVYIAAGKSGFSAKVTLKRKGSWRIRIKHSDSTHATSYSSYRYVKVK